MRLWRLFGFAGHPPQDAERPPVVIQRAAAQVFQRAPVTDNVTIPNLPHGVCPGRRTKFCKSDHAIQLLPTVLFAPLSAVVMPQLSDFLRDAHEAALPSTS